MADEAEQTIIAKPGLEGVIAGDTEICCVEQGELLYRGYKIAELAETVPSRVEVQSFTFISPMGDSVRYLMSPANFAYINFGVTALAGVIVGSFLYALLSGGFRIEWFVSGGDFANHAIGGVLMGIGGVLAMGCTVGQAITGVSTLAMGSFLTFFAIVAGAAATMKFQYWRMMQEE